MSIRQKIRFQSLFYSIIISIITCLLALLAFGEFSIESILNFNFFLLFILCSIMVYAIGALFVKFFLYNSVKLISDEIFKSDDQSTVTTNMEDLLSQIKDYDDERKFEISEMKKQESFRRDFIGNLAHELKTPLFTSESYILTLLDGAINDEEVNKKYLKIAGKAINRLNLIVKDLDLITKIESGESGIEKTDFDIINLAQNIFEMLEISASKKNIKLILDHDSNLPINVNADNEKIQQVLTNLIENSIKYGKENGTTEIVIQDLTESKVIVRVTDNGLGIEEKHFNRLFERFYRVDQSGSRNAGGSGLGLAIVKHIMDAHDEKIYIESDFGVGSEFSFTLEKSVI
ncbi:MAG: sensor histidine kinase [Cryomorphaceae bacterium]|nr:MAG: sensor histidine kinase [Cryomorphaceae bacterium]